MEIAASLDEMPFPPPPPPMEDAHDVHDAQDVDDMPPPPPPEPCTTDDFDPEDLPSVLPEFHFTNLENAPEDKTPAPDATQEIDMTNPNEMMKVFDPVPGDSSSVAKKREAARNQLAGRVASWNNWMAKLEKAENESRREFLQGKVHEVFDKFLDKYNERYDVLEARLEKENRQSLTAEQIENHNLPERMPDLPPPGLPLVAVGGKPFNIELATLAAMELKKAETEFGLTVRGFQNARNNISDWINQRLCYSADTGTVYMLRGEPSPCLMKYTPKEHTTCCQQAGNAIISSKWAKMLKENGSTAPRNWIETWLYDPLRRRTATHSEYRPPHNYLTWDRTKEQFFNLFQGYQFRSGNPQSDNVRRILADISDILRDNGTAAINQVLDFYADTLQNPGQKMPYALFLLGIPRCGKGALMSLLAEILGREQVLTTEGSKMLKDNFLEVGGCLLFGINEAERTMNECQRVLKSIIGDQDRHKRVKFQQGAASERVVARVILTANDNDGAAVTIEDKERHFLVLRCNRGENGKERDLSHWFTKEALSDFGAYLLARKVDPVKLRNSRITTLEQQKQRALQIHHGDRFCVHLLLQRPQYFGFGDEEKAVIKDVIRGEYNSFMENYSRSRCKPMDPIALAKKLFAVFGVRNYGRQGQGSGNRWAFPPFTLAKKRLEMHLDLPISLFGEPVAAPDVHRPEPEVTLDDLLNDDPVTQSDKNPPAEDAHPSSQEAADMHQTGNTQAGSVTVEQLEDILSEMG
jgi:hypothetical protein